MEHLEIASHNYINEFMLLNLLLIGWISQFEVSYLNIQNI